MRQCVKFFIKMNKNSRKSLAIFIFLSTFAIATHGR